MITIEASKSEWADTEDILTISNDLKSVFNNIACNMECNKNYSKGNIKKYHRLTIFTYNYLSIVI
jgi:hypothetical protein